MTLTSKYRSETHESSNRTALPRVKVMRVRVAPTAYDWTVATGRKMEPVDLSQELRECAGQWVALRGGRVVEVRETPYALVMALHDRGIDDATILRAPGPAEPELVGFG